ncbi:MAG: GNAT family N-acetyltransferase [Gammaproteobacteria bacterium]|nr:GNAT family N-acetyltransferase [Gammaproteobacteria bacterium]
MTHPLDNVIWNTLVGPHAVYAAGDRGARRYARGFSPIAGFADPLDPDFGALRPWCEAGEQLYCSGWDGPAPAGWRVEADAKMCLMVCASDPPPASGVVPDAGFGQPLRLGPQHAQQAMELAQLTRPGPFGLRTIELGDYFGYFEGARLAAMAGERMHLGRLREISGVCTHPDFQGRGLARALMLRLMALQRGRGQTPFLHVMSANGGARRLYERLGFRNYLEPVVRVISVRTP